MKEITFKELVFGFFAMLFILAAAYCLYIATSATELTSRETSLLSFLLAVLSILASWLASHLYSNYSERKEQLQSQKEREEKIDIVAKQASEKITNLSTQLWRLERYFEDSLEEVMEEDDQTCSATLINRIKSASYMIRNIRSTENTFVSDWKGIVSVEAQELIDEHLRNHADIIDKYAEIEKARSLEGGSGGGSSDRINELADQIDKIRAKMPATSVPESVNRLLPAASVYQIHDSGDDKIQSGKLEIKLLRPVFNVTGSGKLNPSFSEPPFLHAELIECPDPTMDILVRAGSGTNFDFNLHLKSNTNGIKLKPGRYLLSYRAVSSIDNDNNQSDMSDGTG